jgi:hypothetical protein
MLRRFFLIGIVLVAGVVVVGPPSGAMVPGRTSGSAEIELRAGAGLAKIRFRGTFIGYVARGRIVATNNVTVTGWESRRRINPTLVAYRGTELRFKVFNTEGRWRLRLNGRGISAGGFVRGCMTFNAFDSGPTGSYRIRSSDFKRWPRQATTYELGLGC